MASEKPQILGDNIGTELVTMYVGKKRKEFIVHKKLICDTTEYFKKAFTGSFKENEGIMYLPEESPDAFSFFVDWLYRGEVPTGNSQEHLIRLFMLYVFAEKLCHDTLANKIMDNIVRQCCTFLKSETTSSMVSYVYKNTFTDSPLRIWTIQDFAFCLWRESESIIPGPVGVKTISRLSKENDDFLEDYLNYLRSWRNRAINTRDERTNWECALHRHGKDEECELENPWAKIIWKSSGKQDIDDFTEND